jgi:hypothetical protein
MVLFQNLASDRIEPDYCHQGGMGGEFERETSTPSWQIRDGSWQIQKPALGKNRSFQGRQDRHAKG